MCQRRRRRQSGGAASGSPAGTVGLLGRSLAMRRLYRTSARPTRGLSQAWRPSCTLGTAERSPPCRGRTAGEKGVVAHGGLILLRRGSGPRLLPDPAALRRGSGERPPSSLCSLGSVAPARAIARSCRSRWRTQGRVGSVPRPALLRSGVWQQPRAAAAAKDEEHARPVCASTPIQLSEQSYREEREKRLPLVTPVPLANSAYRLSLGWAATPITPVRLHARAHVDMAGSTIRPAACCAKRGCPMLSAWTSATPGFCCRACHRAGRLPDVQLWTQGAGLRVLFAGLTLCIYPYFVGSVVLVWVVCSRR